MVPTKVCPIVFRDSTALKVMVFRHPSGGVQFVKGTIESGERPADAALRELREESGITDAVVSQDLGLWDADHDAQIWSLQLVLCHERFQNSGITDVTTTVASTCTSSGTTSTRNPHRTGILYFNGC
jgi:8-oxo-dGTP pyrophosphatase MutT (NUDIX family)